MDGKELLELESKLSIPEYFLKNYLNEVLERTYLHNFYEILVTSAEYIEILKITIGLFYYDYISFSKIFEIIESGNNIETQDETISDNESNDEENNLIENDVTTVVNFITGLAHLLKEKELFKDHRNMEFLRDHISSVYTTKEDIILYKDYQNIEDEMEKIFNDSLAIEFGSGVPKYIAEKIKNWLLNFKTNDVAKLASVFLRINDAEAGIENEPLLFSYLINFEGKISNEQYFKDNVLTTFYDNNFKNTMETEILNYITLNQLSDLIKIILDQCASRTINYK